MITTSNTLVQGTRIAHRTKKLHKKFAMSQNTYILSQTFNSKGQMSLHFDWARLRECPCRQNLGAFYSEMIEEKIHTPCEQNKPKKQVQ